MPESINELDWKKLHKLLPTIEMLHKQNKTDSAVNAELANLIYQAESTLAALKENYKLPNLNNSIKSKSVEKVYWILVEHHQMKMIFLKEA